MNTWFAIALFVALAVASRPVIDHNLIREINSKQDSWKAGINEYFTNWTVARVKTLMGYKPRAERLKFPIRSHNLEEFQIPTQFNSADKWPTCKTIGTIYNQADCGSCWAFGCVEAVSDRFCIHSKTRQPIALSFSDETCCGPDDGCEGGDPGDAWSYVQSTGLVTNKCYPYTIPTCPPSQQPCLNFVSTPACVQTCVDGETWATSKHFTNSTYYVSSNADQIATEIMLNGPVEACFSVYEDFVHYKSGVYQQTSNNYLGGHCVKIIGWGVESGLPYWLVNNSWTTYWGNKGQFKILRGQDTCGIEDSVVAGFPQY